MSISMIEILIAALLGVLLGIGLYWLMYRSRFSKAEGLNKELEQRNQELSEVREQLQHMVQRDRDQSDYKSKVDDHFVETAALINQMTQSYKAVYDHLEKGAFSLVGKETLQERLGDIQSEPVRLEYIGLGSTQSAEAREIGYVLVLEQDLPENEQLLKQLAEALGVSLQDIPEALHSVLTQPVAQRLEQILHDHSVSASVKPTTELFDSLNANHVP